MSRQSLWARSAHAWQEAERRGLSGMARRRATRYCRMLSEGCGELTSGRRQAAEERHDHEKRLRGVTKSNALYEFRIPPSLSPNSSTHTPYFCSDLTIPVESG